MFARLFPHFFPSRTRVKSRLKIKLTPSTHRQCLSWVCVYGSMSLYLRLGKLEASKHGEKAAAYLR